MQQEGGFGFRLIFPLVLSQFDALEQSAQLLREKLERQGSEREIVDWIFVLPSCEPLA